MGPSLSGFMVPGQTRDIERVRTAKGDVIIVSRNNDRPLVFSTAPPVRLAERRTSR